MAKPVIRARTGSPVPVTAYRASVTWSGASAMGEGWTTTGTIYCDHAHRTYDAALRCQERLAGTIRNNPMSFPEIANSYREDV